MSVYHFQTQVESHTLLAVVQVVCSLNNITPWMTFRSSSFFLAASEHSTECRAPVVPRSSLSPSAAVEIVVRTSCKIPLLSIETAGGRDSAQVGDSQAKQERLERHLVGSQNTWGRDSSPSLGDLEQASWGHSSLSHKIRGRGKSTFTPLMYLSLKLCRYVLKWHWDTTKEDEEQNHHFYTQH